MPFRAIIFDLDGTLLDTLDDIATAANHVLAGQGFAPHPMPAYREFIGEGVVRLMMQVLPEKHRDETNAYDADATFDNYVQEVYAAGWQNYHPDQHGSLRDG